MSINPNPYPSFGSQPPPPPPAAPPPPPSGGGGWKFGVLFGAVVALAGATGYLFYQVSNLNKEVLHTREAVASDMASLRETSTVSAQTARRTVETLKADLEAERKRIAQLTGQAKVEAIKHADELATRLERAQSEQAKQFRAEVTEVKTATSAANTKIGEVASDVGTVKSDLSATKSELDKTIAALRSAQGDLTGHASLIATNAKELSALRALGERIYTEFKLGKTKAPQKVGEVAILLKRTDPKRNRYTIEVIADDKRVEKRDKTVNEPVQFLTSRASQHYEIVVNDIKKDLISGYVSAPKVAGSRTN